MMEKPRVFISWSGSLSHIVAEALHQYLTIILPSVETWISSVDIVAGNRWEVELNDKLRASVFGIICITRENMMSAWMSYEAGAIAHTRGFSDEGFDTVYPLLVDLRDNEVKGPLSRLQCKELSAQAIREIGRRVNEVLSGEIDIDRLDRSVDLVWPKIEAVRDAARRNVLQGEGKLEDRGLLEEIHSSLSRLDFRVGQMDDDVHELIQSIAVRQVGIKSTGMEWVRFVPVLDRLTGTWLQYIPDRVEERCPFSIVNFHKTKHGKYAFSGTNYFLDGQPNYNFQSLKILAPVQMDPKTLFLYYIYRRSGNPMFEGKHGFSKIRAVKVSALDDNYFLCGGFFFNEATKGGYFPMSLLPCHDLAKRLQIDFHPESATGSERAPFFRALLDAGDTIPWPERDA